MNKEIKNEYEKEIKEILDKEIDPIFLEIAQKIAPKITAQKYLPWLLAHKMDVKGAIVLNSLPDNDWFPDLGEFHISDSFVEKIGMTKSYIEEQLEERYYSGDIMWDDEKGPIITYSRGLWIDIQHNEDWIKKNGTAYYKIIGIMIDQEFTPLMEADTEERIKIGKTGMCRIIPQYNSVKDCPELLPAENYKEILKSRKVIAQLSCACRIRFPEAGQDEKVCLCADKAAEWAIKLGMGKQVTWEYAFDYLQKSVLKQPFIHMNKHSDQLKDIGDILCNCEVTTCAVMRNTMVNGGEHKVWDYYAKSRYRAVIDAEKCIDCGICKNKRCMFDAIIVTYNKEFGKEKHFVNEPICMGCGCCVETCPKDAITMVLVDPPEVLKGFKHKSGLENSIKNQNDEIETNSSMPKKKFPYL